MPSFKSRNNYDKHKSTKKAIRYRFTDPNYRKSLNLKIGNTITYTDGCMSILARREGTLGCLIHKSPKFYFNVSLFVRLTTLGTFD